jgi:glucosamine-6-phosphate deaminase
MKLIEAKDYHEMSKLAAEIILKQVKEKEDSVLGLATGGTVLGTYQELIHDFKKNKTSYDHIQTFNLDEYAGLKKEDPNSYHSYMKINLFDNIYIPVEQTHLPNGEASDLEEQCSAFERIIEASGGIDLQLLGIGQNGHIGFNEPGSLFDSKTHVVTLAESTRKANSCYFASNEEVPTRAVTMGISTIMKSKKILLLASGTQKASIIYDLFHSEVTNSIPATILRKHADTTIIADQDALSKLNQAKRYA